MTIRIAARAEVSYPCALCGQETTPDHFCKGCGVLVGACCDTNHFLPVRHQPAQHAEHPTDNHFIGA